jgi:hypothetical protein
MSSYINLIYYLKIKKAAMPLIFLYKNNIDPWFPIGIGHNIENLHFVGGTYIQ